MAELEQSIAREARHSAKCVRSGDPDRHGGLRTEVARVLDLLANLAISVSANSNVLEEVVQDMNQMHQREADLSKRLAAVRQAYNPGALSGEMEAKVPTTREFCDKVNMDTLAENLRTEGKVDAGRTLAALRTTLVRAGALLQRIERHWQERAAGHFPVDRAEVMAALEDINRALK